MIKKPIFIILVFMLLILPEARSFAAFEMSLAEGFQTIDFGTMQMDEKKSITRKGNYEHRFDFTSDTGRTWYFKTHMMRPFTSAQHSIPAENMQWIVEQVVNGGGLVSNSVGSPGNFSTSPVLIYTSSGNDSTGTTVQIKLKYNLKIPEYQAAGSYTAHIRFIMVEVL
ncbi:MAG: hypothetical protein ISS92_05415 [Candidatus Omnitrophica bacterium]|nr:hypothetical protein [Candidatus Omnitrophota bacterium]